MNPYSEIKVFHHHNALQLCDKGVPIAPIYIRLKPTNICNHHCSYCTYGSGNTFQKTNNRDGINHRDVIPWEKMREIINDMGDMGVKAVTLSGGGEPLTYPSIVETMELFDQNNIDTSLISNGELLDGEVAQKFYNSSWVRISFDSPVREEYCELRGVSPERFERVITNISSFAEHKSKECVLGINYVVNKWNYNHVYLAADMLKSLGVDNVKFAAVSDNSPGYHNQIKDEVIKQIHDAKEKLEDDAFCIINNYENDWMDKNLAAPDLENCYTCKFVTVIAADQKIYLCHTRAYDSRAVVADLKEGSLKELWFSDDVQNKLQNINPKINCKNYCAYESRNKLLQAYYDADNNQVNFI